MTLHSDFFMAVYGYRKTHAQLVAQGRDPTEVGRDQVMPGIAEMIHDVQVEATFPDGTKLVTVFDPIQPAAGEIRPGEVIPAEGEIELNAGRERRVIESSFFGPTR